MLKCVSKYRNVALRLYVEPGDLIRDLSDDMEALLLRDSPGSFERVIESKGLDTPPSHRMVTREQVERKSSERGPGPVMTRADHPGLVRPKGG